ncbi:type I polyketide synthase [Kibdelosporangium aridum]|uniref:Type I polyketide synthase n=2 Tax=Kibdelosporangium aridum TaxID=2030 RepID=A0A428ZRK9_KIBAR|nr:type I polyketide synthase [Kibdelosporangium aridum]
MGMAGLPSAPVAIVGIGCRFPGARGPGEFWQRLRAGYDGIAKPPAGRFDGLPWKESADNPVEAGYLSDVDKFDPDFFGVSHREARRMDPQLRLLLEVTWESLEDAGLRPADTEGGRVGVFIGQIASDYWELHSGNADNAAIDRYIGLANIRGMLSGRLSHVFDWSGPSVSVDTACSSSLAAVRMACQSLYSGESTVAVAGGVNLMLVRKDYPWLFMGGVLSRDGRCKFGDASADGYGRGEGLGLVVLKTLDRAIADRDRIYAVIRGSAINNDGRASGFAARPAVRGQADVLSAALADAGASPTEIEYVEAHGTGTAVGDAVELAALAAVLGEGRSQADPLRVGSVKTNIGHTEAAAGIAGLIKSTLCLYHGEIPPSLHVRELNPAVEWDELPLKVHTELEPLPSHGRPRLVGVSSFGVSGTNVHAILAEVEQQPVVPSEGDYVLTLSARTPQGVRDLAGAYASFLRDTEVPLRDICYSASARRQHHSNRIAVAGSSHEDVAAKLRSFVDGKPSRDVSFSGEVPEVEPGIAFVFPGQGSQWFGMGLQLLDTSSVFRSALEECDRAVRAECGWSVIEQLARDDERSHDVDVVQPMLFAIQVGLAAVWRSWGVEPDLVIGHSMGEVAAAHVAGALSLTDAVAVICRRSKLAAAVAGRGAMASIALPMGHVAETLAGYQDKVSIAASNSPSTTLISGEPSAVDDIVASLQHRDVFCRRIDVPFAAHSPHVDELRDELLERLANVRPQAGRTRIHSTVLDADVDGRGFDASYWVRNFREPVRFASAVRQVSADRHLVFVEISPHPVLLSSIEECLQEAQNPGAAVSSLRREKPELRTLLTSLGELYAKGCQIDWNRLYGEEARLVSLPAYPWAHGSYWIKTREPAPPRPGHPLLGRPIAAAERERVWEGPLDRTRNRYLDGHRVQGMITFPGSGYCELAFAAAREALGQGDLVVEDAVFQQLLLLNGHESPTLRVRMHPENDSGWRIEIHSGTSHQTVQHASFRVRTVADAQEQAHDPLPAVRARCPEHLPGDEFYIRFGGGENEWDGPFRGAVEVWRGDGEALIRVSCPDSLAAMFDDFYFHPAMLDACGHALMATAEPVAQAFAAESFHSARIWGKPQRELFSHARLTERGAGTLTGDIVVMQSDGTPVADIRGVRLRCLAEPAAQRQNYDDWLYELQWERSDRPQRNIELASGTWIILDDGRAVGRGLRKRIEDAGGHCVSVVPAGSAVHGDFVVDPRDPMGFCAVLRAASGPVRGIVHLWSLDNPTDVASEEDVKRAQNLTCSSTVQLIKDLAASPEVGHPALWLVTSNVYAVTQDDVSISPLSALLWGFGRVLAQENPELKPVLVDVDVTDPDWAAETLFGELTVHDRETERALRRAGRYVSRINRYSAPPAPAARPSGAYRVRHGAPGCLDEFTVERAERRKPGAGEVEIEIAFAGLNYADVLGVMGVVPGIDAQDRVPGAECAGKVTALGPMTHGLQVGDEVVAVGNLGLGSHVIAKAPLALKRPRTLDLADAATVPIAYLTAYHALHKLAGLRRGERVLIHTATGGVGLAAIQVAKMLGAEIYATAGSREKRSLLRTMGIKYVADSRSLDFADEFLAATYGKGVDVVLNTLPGPAIEKNLDLLAPYGRYVELTKKDILGDGQIPLRPLARNISVHVVDVMDMWQTRPEQVGATLREVFTLIDTGALAPLPADKFASERTGNAFRHLAQSKQIGKVLLSFDANEPEPLVRADATYLVTGGLGGIGTEVARWLVEQGAKHLLLVGRAELPPRSTWPHLDRDSAEYRRVGALESLEQTGIHVRYEAVDVADEAALRSLISEMDHPVRGVFHTAGIVDWHLVRDLDDERLAAVLRPKVAGSLVLDRIFPDSSLDMFVLFSSIAGWMSSPLLAAYSAANNFLDSLAHQRRLRGAPATGINWGFWDAIGMSAGVNDKVRVIPKGFSHFSPADGIAVLERLIRADVEQVGVLVADWAKWSAIHHHFAQLPMLSKLVPTTTDRPAPGEVDKDIVRRYLIDRIAEALEVTPDHVNTRQPLNRMGLDSLGAIELKNLASRDLGVDLPVVMLLGGFTLDDLIDQLGSA